MMITFQNMFGLGSSYGAIFLARQNFTKVLTSKAYPSSSKKAGILPESKDGVIYFL